MAESVRDQNFVTSMLFESASTSGLTITAKGDQTTGRLYVDMPGGTGTVTSVATGTGLTGGTITTTGTISLATSLQPMATLTGNALKVLRVNAGETAVEYASVGSGTVTSVSVVSANGLAGTVATATTTPAITLSTTITGILKGNGTAISAATDGTDYLSSTTGLKLDQTASQTISNGQPIWSTLTASQAVVTDANKKFASLSYVTTATASTLAQRDSNANIYANNFFANNTSTVAAAGTTVLTVASSRFQTLTGATSQTFQLPDATTLVAGHIFTFNNNASGSLIITNNGTTTLYTEPAGGYTTANLLDNSTANGSWDFHASPPSTVTWGSGVTGFVMNTALTTSPTVSAGASSSTAPSFIPQRGASTTGFGGDGTSLFATVGGASIVGFGSGGLTMSDAKDIILNTTTGTKIGTATTQKLGFYNATPVVQQTGDVITGLQTLGLMASATVNATTISTATESTDTTCFPVFVTASGTQTLAAKTNTTLTYNSNTNDLGVTKINGLTMTASTGTFTLTNAKTLSVSNTLTLAGTDSTTMTFPSTSATIARTDAANTFTGAQTFSNAVINTNNAITASGNAATIPITARLHTVTNNSAATLTITLTTTSATDGQLHMIRILDASAAAQTITWVNTENSTVTAPVTSNGSTTLPLTVGFQYNSATSKWRCIASA